MQIMKVHKFAIIVAGCWLLAVWALVLVAQALHGAPLSLAAWAGDWDGGWYRSIVEHGYATGPFIGQANVAFFPLYPLAVWLVHAVTFLPVVWAGMLVSAVSFVAALAVLHAWALAAFGRPVARRAVLLLAFNPFSFYFGMMYTEALFVFLAAATFLFLWRRQWWHAALMAGLASGTRSVGVVLGVIVVIGYHVGRKGLDWGPVAQGSSPQVLAGIPAARQRVPLLRATPFFSLRFVKRTAQLSRRVTAGFADLEGLLFPIGRLWRSMQSYFTPFVESFSSNKWDTKKRTKAEFPTAGVNPQGRQSLAWAYVMKSIMFCTLAFSGLLAFSIYLYFHTGDAFAYSHVQHFWPGRDGLASLAHELHYLFAHKALNKEYFITIMWYICAAIAFAGVGLLAAMRQYMLAFFAAVTLLLPILFGSVGGLNRYALAAVPIFVGYAWLLQKWPRWAREVVLVFCVFGLFATIFIMTSPDHPFLG